MTPKNPLELKDLVVFVYESDKDMAPESIVFAGIYKNQKVLIGAKPDSTQSKVVDHMDKKVRLGQMNQTPFQQLVVLTRGSYPPPNQFLVLDKDNEKLVKKLFKKWYPDGSKDVESL